MIRKSEIQQHFDHIADQRGVWFEQNRIYHQQIIECCQIFINPGSRVLELGCSVGNLLNALQPDYGVGLDISEKSIAQARKNYPQYRWICADAEELPNSLAEEEPFDLIIVEDLMGYLNHIQAFLDKIKPLMHPGTRLVISTWNWMWEPILHLGEILRLKAPSLYVRQNWISAKALSNFLALTDYEILEVRPGLLLPYELPLLTETVNSLSHAPILSRFTLLSTIITRPIFETEEAFPEYSVSVIIPTRNEVGNIEALVERTPDMGKHTEIIFVDGNSTDGTVEAIHQAIQDYPQRDIKFIPQVPEMVGNETPSNLMLKLGKGDAVRKGFAAAKGDILMILDSDVSVLPEDLVSFYHALASGKAQFANGTRFIYQQEPGAMQSLNRVGNIFFSLVFSWLLDQRITDTLCGTKVLFRKDYEAIAANRKYFGNFDPFGDFDLLFGAAWLRQSIVEVPIRYQSRTYGESKVRVGIHGPLLVQMSVIALWKFKIRPRLFNSSRPMPAEETAKTSKFGLLKWLPLWAILLSLLTFLLRRRK